MTPSQMLTPSISPSDVSPAATALLRSSMTGGPARSLHLLVEQYQLVHQLIDAAAGLRGELLDRRILHGGDIGAEFVRAPRHRPGLAEQCRDHLRRRRIRLVHVVLGHPVSPVSAIACRNHGKPGDTAGLSPGSGGQVPHPHRVARLPEITTMRPSSCAVATAPPRRRCGRSTVTRWAFRWPASLSPRPLGGQPLAHRVWLGPPSRSSPEPPTEPTRRRRPTAAAAPAHMSGVDPSSQRPGVSRSRGRLRGRRRSRQSSTDWPDNDLRAIDEDLRPVLLLQRQVHQVLTYGDALVSVSVC